MTGIHIQQLTDEDLQYDGFFDGQQKIIPDNEELRFIVVGGFSGVEDGKAISTCFVEVKITEPGEFCGQTYKYNVKMFAEKASTRDNAMRNLGLLDFQAGHPMSKGKLDISTENIEQFWAGKAQAILKMGQFTPTEEDGSPKQDAQGNPESPINFVRGFKYDRERIFNQEEHDQMQAQQQAEAQAEVAQGPAYTQNQVTDQTPPFKKESTATQPEEDVIPGF